MSDLPRQKLALSEKTQEWREECVEAIVSNSHFGAGFTPFSQADWRHTIKKCYEYYNGIIDDGDYEHVLKPYGKTRDNMPAKLRNYPIIKPIIDLLLGEKKKRPINTVVGVLNSDVVTIKTQKLAEHLNKVYQQKFLNLLAEQGVDTGLPTEETPEPEEAKKAFEGSYRDERAIRAQQGLDYILHEEEIPRKFQDGFKDFLIAGRVFSIRGVNHDEPEYDILNPLHVDYSKDSTTDFIEDASWAAYNRFLTPDRVIDEFYDHLTPDQIDQIDSGELETNGSFFIDEQEEDDTFQKGRKKIEVVTVYWKSLEKVGFVDYIDPTTGDLETKEVDETYRAAPGETIDWIWRGQVWQGHKVGDSLYLDVRPCTVQRRSLDNRSTCKLPINGRKYSDRNASPVSMVLLMIPYQLQYNVYKYRLDLSIAKSKDLIAVFDINMIPEEKGIDMDTWLYHVDSTGIAWVDYSKEGVRMNPQHQTVLDMSIKTIQAYVVLLESIVQEVERMTGVTRQRQGNTSQYELKGTTEQSIIQSSHITEDMFSRFADFERRDLQALLDYSKEAWIFGKKAAYVMDDLTNEFFEIDGIEHAETEYGIVVADSYEERQKIEMVRQLGVALAQGGAPISTVIDIMEAHSMPQLKAKIRDAEAAQQKLAQAQQQVEQQTLKAQQEFESAKLQNENVQKDLDRKNKLDVALIQAENQRFIAELNAAGEDKPETGEDPRKLNLEARKVNLDTKEQKDRIQLDRDRLQQEGELKRAEIEVKKKQAAKAAAKPASKK